jgi:hypothetical protein
MTCYSQLRDSIVLVNPSFEDIPTCCKAPKGWTECGFKGETPPDVQPAMDQHNNPFFNVTTEPYDGDTYLGMVTRENDTYEGVVQKLARPLLKDRCYSFSVMLCRSDTYLSASNKGRPTDLKKFNNFIRLRIWGGETFCHMKELLAASPLIRSTEWERYDFQFKPANNIDFIELQAYYQEGAINPYNGNILLDKASAIIETSCN